MCSIYIFLRFSISLKRKTQEKFVLRHNKSLIHNIMKSNNIRYFMIKIIKNYDKLHHIFTKYQYYRLTA